MKQQKRTATIIDFEEARKKRMLVVSQLCAAAGSNPNSDMEGTVRVTLVNGTVINADIGDISVEGIRLRTSGTMAQTLYKPGHFISNDNSPNIDIAIDLPLPDGELRVRARCRLVCFKMISPEEVTFTLYFMAFVGAGEAILRHFIRLCEKSEDGGPHYEAEIVEFKKRGAS